MGISLSMVILVDDDLQTLVPTTIARTGRCWMSEDSAALSDQVWRRGDGLLLGVGASCLVLVGDTIGFDGRDFFEGVELGVALYASENHGGANFVHIYEYGVRVRVWEETATGSGDPHPLEVGLDVDTHPFNYVSRVAQQLIGAGLDGVWPNNFRFLRLHDV
ncbi:MAG: hypothetical protein ACRBN8_28915 [Nannocystales bacterium]